MSTGWSVAPFIGLPHLDQCAPNRAPAVIENVPPYGNRHALGARLARRKARQIVVALAQQRLRKERTYRLRRRHHRDRPAWRSGLMDHIALDQLELSSLRDRSTDEELWSRTVCASLFNPASPRCHG